MAPPVAVKLYLDLAKSVYRIHWSRVHETNNSYHILKVKQIWIKLPFKNMVLSFFTLHIVFYKRVNWPTLSSYRSLRPSLLPPSNSFLRTNDWLIFEPPLGKTLDMRNQQTTRLLSNVLKFPWPTYTVQS